MDFKRKRFAFLLSGSLILLVAILVLLTNPVKPQKKRPVKNNSISETQKPQENTDNQQVGNDLTAFLRDEKFFDADESWREDIHTNVQNNLSLIMTSVERDLRIQIVDIRRKPVRGESFYVKLENQGEFKDLDKDGVIYIAALEPGEYYVQLMPMEGYHVPVSKSRIRVKDKVEYSVIEDIALLIKKASEVDADIDDHRILDALQDTDNTEVNKLQSVSGGAKIGIDVSERQGSIDWDKVKEAGIDFAIIRAGYRGISSGALVEDVMFETNMRGAAAAGVAVGISFESQAISEVEAVEEASMVLSLAEHYKISYPVYLIMDGAENQGRADTLDVSTKTYITEAFCNTIRNEGYSAGIYGSRNFFHQKIITSRVEQNDIWLAEYRGVPLYQGYYQMWQYTSKAEISGITGKVNLNISYPKAE